MKGKVVYMKGLRINFLLKFVIDNLDYSWPKDACIRLVPTVIFLLEFPLDIWFKEEKKSFVNPILTVSSTYAKCKML